ncbi:MAG: response regulator [Verrucomicrobia bacterium]|nr:response regulator [Verrucomicrobiota bacterium]
MVAKGMLQRLGLRADVVGNGLEAVRAVRNLPYDLVFMDVQMPEMDGLEATKQIRHFKDVDDLPIVAMTAHAMEGDEQVCLRAGMNDYVSKPISMDSLKRVVKVFGLG